MSYETFYEGLGSTFEYDSNKRYGGDSLFQGYNVLFSRIGAPTSPQTANVLSEVTARMNEGIRTVELQPLSQDLFESIPKQHFKEVNRLMKLTGGEATLHAPLIDPAGFNNQNGAWSADDRQQAENKLKDIIDLAHEMNPEGNVPITLHATGGMPAGTLRKGEVREGDMFFVIEQDSGQLHTLKRGWGYDPKTKKEILLNPRDKIEETNKRIIDDNLATFIQYTEKAKEFSREVLPAVAPFIQDYRSGRLKEEDLTLNQRQALNALGSAGPYLNKAREDLLELTAKTKKAIPEDQQKIMGPKIDGIRRQIFELEHSRQEEVDPLSASIRLSQIASDFKRITDQTTPQFIVPLNQFALDKTKETIAQAALHSYKKFGNSAPIISLENFFAGTLFSSGKDMKELVQESRKEFVKLAEKQGISREKAEEAAAKGIGATWDVGHLNMMRKHGFNEEDIIKETKTVAPFIKHVHLTDNFGYGDTHLPPGMGNVPFKKIFEELEKAGFSGKEIVEAGGFVANKFGSPTPYVLEALGSPIYAPDMQGTWNQAKMNYGMPGNYASGYGLMLPTQHFSMYGSGFAGLPQELGGQVPGSGQRFSGTSMD